MESAKNPPEKSNPIDMFMFTICSKLCRKLHDVKTKICQCLLYEHVDDDEKISDLRKVLLQRRVDESGVSSRYVGIFNDLPEVITEQMVELTQKEVIDLQKMLNSIADIIRNGESATKQIEMISNILI